MDYVIEATLLVGLVWLWLHQRYVHKELTKDVQQTYVHKPADPTVVIHQVTRGVEIGRTP